MKEQLLPQWENNIHAKDHDTKKTLNLTSLKNQMHPSARKDPQK